MTKLSGFARNLFSIFSFLMFFLFSFQISSSNAEQISFGKILDERLISKYLTEKSNKRIFDPSNKIYFNMWLNKEVMNSNNEGMFYTEFMYFVGTFFNISVLFNDLEYSSNRFFIISPGIEAEGQKIKIIVDNEIVEKLKNNFFDVFDAAEVNKLSDSDDCYIEMSITDKKINVFADLQGRFTACIYTAFLNSVGIRGGYNDFIPNDDYIAESIGFIRSIEMLSVRLRDECDEYINDKGRFSDCIDSGLERGR